MALREFPSKRISVPSGRASVVQDTCRTMNAWPARSDAALRV